MTLVAVIAIGLSLYALYATRVPVQTQKYRYIFLAVALVLTFLLYPARRRGTGRGCRSRPCGDGARGRDAGAASRRRGQRPHRAAGSGRADRCSSCCP